MSLGSLVIELQANVARLDTDMGAAESVIASRVKRIEATVAQISRNVESAGAANAGVFVERMRGAEEAYRRTGISAAQAANAMRMVPAQMTDIVTQLAGGQNPLLVLTQQGGQLKDMFGGIGPAIRGFGTYVAGLINPLTLSAAAAAALGYAMYKGAQEAEAFGKSLLMTGNYAGVTADSYNAMAKHVSASMKETVGASREALAAVVATGAFTRSQLSLATQDVIAFAKASGQSVEDVAKDYAKMGEGVADWAEKHNRSLHYMTAATYDRIKALEDAGKTEQALMVNLEALHNRFADVANEKLGIVERAWKATKNAISGTWEALKSIGRPETTQDRIDALERQRAQASRRFDAQGTNSAAWSKQNEQELANLREMQRLENSQASRQSVIARQQQAAIKATDDLEKLRVQFDKSYAKQKEIDKLNRDFAALAVGNPNSPMLKGVKVSADDAGGFKFAGGGYDKALAGINDRYKDTKGAAIDKASLEAQLRPMQDAIKAEKDLLAQREKFLDMYYKSGQISADTFFDGQRNALQEHVDKTTALYDRQIAAVQAYAGKTADAEKKIEASRRAQALADERDRAIAGDKAKLIEIDLEKSKATDDYRLSVQKLTDELDKLEGRLRDNSLGEFDRTHDALKKRIAAESDPKAQATFDRLREVTAAQGRISEIQAQGKQVMDRLATRQAEIDASVTMGVLTQLEGMGRLGDARKAAYADLLELDNKLTELLGTQELTAAQLDNISRFHTQVQTLGASADVLKEKLSSAIGGEFANMLEGLVNRTKSFKDAINDFASSITRMVTQLAANSIAQKLFSTGGAAGASGGSGEGFMGMAMSFLSSMFGGGKASGGPVSRGKFYEVNENGPELLTVANRTYLMAGGEGRVTPMSSGGGGRSTVMHMNINVPAGTTRQTAQQQASAIMRQAQLAQARNS